MVKQSCCYSLESVEKVSAFLTEHQLKLHYVLETHAHADHLTGAQYLKRRFGAGVVISHPGDGR